MSVVKIPTQRKTSALTQKELYMLRTSSGLSDKEIKLWHDEFIEKYPDGKLTKAAFGELMKKYCPECKADNAVETAFDLLDKNKDGSIEFNEFLFVAAMFNRVGSIEERLDVIFDLWDVSDDKQLDQNELAHLISAMYDRARVTDRQGNRNPHTRAKEIITKLDISGDKKLSRDEFIKGCKNDEIILKLLTTGQ